MCVQIFHIMNIDVPAGVGAPPTRQPLNCRFCEGILWGAV